MIEYAYGFINTIIYIIILFGFSNEWMKKRTFREKLINQNFFNKLFYGVILSIWIIVDFFVSVILNNYTIIKMIVIVLINCIMLNIIYEKEILKSIFLTFIYQALALLCDYVSMVFLMRLNNSITLESITGTLSGFMMSILSQALLILLVFTIIRTSRKTDLLTDFIWIELSIMPIISILCIIAMYINFSNVSSVYQKNTILLLSIVFIFLNIYVYFLVYKTAEAKLIEAKNVMLEERNRQIYNIYNETADNYKFIRKKEHEYQNVLLAMLSLVKESDYDKMIDLLEKELDVKDERYYYFDTNNSVTNLIFNRMYHVAEGRNMLISYKFNDLSRMPLSEKDTVVVYENLIKNAMEACEKLRNKRRIYVESRCQESNFILKVENKFDGKTDEKTDDFFLEKKDIKHGYGIENIKEIVKKYDGFFSNNIKGDVFKTVIIIPIQKENIKKYGGNEIDGKK